MTKTLLVELTIDEATALEIHSSVVDYGVQTPLSDDLRSARLKLLNALSTSGHKWQMPITRIKYNS